MQNRELQAARQSAERLSERYTDLYDFAPTGYFSLDKQARIIEVNLTGAVMLGEERAQLGERSLTRFVAPESRPTFLSFLKGYFPDAANNVAR